ncbi:MAG TPA: VWA domain-containing protein, partial [Casimicrobiaceae bacterium]|nr:VWA domain-containing protein [Casimicrobiaceae bacterium]
MTIPGPGLRGQQKLAGNILQFARVLRTAGLPIGPAKVIVALDAVAAVGVANRDDFRAALESVLIERHEHKILFDQAFELYWRNPRLLERMMALLLPKVRGRAPPAEAQAPLPARLAAAMATSPQGDLETAEREIELDAAFTFSPREVLQTRDFESMTGAELAQVKAMISRLRLPLPELPVRRTTAAPRGHAVDMRATLRAM